ncbi:MAG: porin [Proteobacteria bacterium]|nr:porin [Pseudomonadota bacterium]
MTKKIALAALAVCGLAGSALADSHPTVTLGGHLDTYWGFVDERDEFRYEDPQDIAGSDRRRDHALVNETKIIVRADGKLDNMYNIKYGGLIYLNADASDDHYDDEYNAQQTMAYFEGMFGRIEAGSYTGASHALHVSATQIARGHSGVDGGGIDSDWWKWINPSGQWDPIINQHVLVPQLFTNNVAIAGIKGVNATKITYFTPIYYGFQGGVTYIPDLESFGTVNEAMGVFKYESFSQGAIYRDVVEGGIHYAGKVMHNVGIKAALVGQMGDPKSFDGEDYHRLRAWEAGLAAHWMNWTVAGAFANQGKSGQTSGATGTENRYWNVGVAYEHGPFGVSLTYASSKSHLELDTSESEKSHVRTFGAGADWRLAKGVKLYADVVHFSLHLADDNATELGNRGTVVRVGSLLNF